MSTTNNLKITTALEKAAKLLAPHLYNFTIIGKSQRTHKLVTATYGELDDLVSAISEVEGDESLQIKRVKTKHTSVYFKP